MEEVNINSTTTTNGEEIETYDIIATKVYEEERRLHNLYQRNLQLIPNRKKKTPCSLPINNSAMKYFTKNSNEILLSFQNYINERRDNQSSTLATLHQCSQFISYLEMTLQKKDLSTLDLLFDVVVNHSLLFHHYFQFLRDNGLKCSTILIRLNSIYHLIQWLRMTNSQHFTELSNVLDRLIIDRNRYNSITTIEQKKKTIDHFIGTRQWVEGGISSLQTMMLDSWPYFDALISLSKYQHLKSHQYSWALGFTLSTLWIYGINARAKSIESMTLKDFKEMEENGFCLSTNFKTVSTYGYQIVSPTDVLRIYVKYLRNQIIPEEIDSDQATLFPTFAKTPLAKGEVSKKINSIFKRYGYDLNVTKLRDMLSCHIEDLHTEGKISNIGEFILMI